MTANVDDMKAFKFNKNASYSTDPVLGRNLIVNDKITTQNMVFKSSGDSFKVTFDDIFNKYLRPDITSQNELDNWVNNPLMFWQNQINFAIWYATSRCGISYKDHMCHEDPLISSLYTFHVYYTVMKILKQMECPMPTDQLWSANHNTFNKRQYNNLCIQYGVDINTKWTVRDGVNPDSHMGLGKCHTDKGIISLGRFQAGALAADNMKSMQPGDSRIDSFDIEIPDGSWRVEKTIHQDLPNNACKEFIL